MHTLFNRLFYLVLFLGFFLPSNSTFYLPLPGVQLRINEFAFFVLPVINLFCYSPSGAIFKNSSLKRNIILLIIVVVFTEVVVKKFMYGQSLGDAIKAIRVGLPLFSSLVLITQGIRADITIVWKTILLAVSASVLIAILSVFVSLPIYPNFDDGADILRQQGGRLGNANFHFGLIGMYLLIQESDKWYSQGKLVKITAILSVFAIILSFNRTLLALMSLEAAYLLWNKFDFKKIMRIASYGVLALAVFFGAYANNQTMRNQIDKRIFSILEGQQSITESTVDGNREVIYNAVEEKLTAGYYLMGLPYKTPIFTWIARWSFQDDRHMTVTDTSIFTIILRYGIIPLLLISIILKQLYSLSNNLFFKTILILILIGSLNLDLLLRLNTTLFLALIFLITKAKINEQDSIHSKDQY
ncbi:hypothetical protein [Ulvibacterium sp.]|uniref:hypothetical protein n=1 Tax=Ulvibacterium sp. TaxID=2665914 RepID=UPI003CC67E05